MSQVHKIDLNSIVLPDDGISWVGRTASWPKPVVGCDSGLLRFTAGGEGGSVDIGAAPVSKACFDAKYGVGITRDETTLFQIPQSDDSVVFKFPSWSWGAHDVICVDRRFAFGCGVDGIAFTSSLGDVSTRRGPTVRSIMNLPYCEQLLYLGPGKHFGPAFLVVSHVDQPFLIELDRSWKKVEYVKVLSIPGSIAGVWGMASRSTPNRVGISLEDGSIRILNDVLQSDGTVVSLDWSEITGSVWSCGPLGRDWLALTDESFFVIKDMALQMTRAGQSGSPIEFFSSEGFAGADDMMFDSLAAYVLINGHALVIDAAALSHMNGRSFAMHSAAPLRKEETLAFRMHDLAQIVL